MDAVTFQRLADDGTPEALKAAAGLYRGDLLDGIAVHDRVFEDWLAGERGRLRGLASDALNGLLGHHVESGDAKAAIATARRLLVLDPLQEAVHRTLMRLHAGQGDRTLSLKQYQACRDVLAAELGVEPEAETERLVEEIRGGLHGTSENLEAHLTLETAPKGTAPDAALPLPLPDKPSIAVLPFVNMSDDPEQIYFSDGLTEDIITELSRFKSLDVVARNSTFVYRDLAVNVSEIGEKVGASHLLEGSVRKSGNRIRLTAQLIDVKTGKHIWADRYDRELADIFALQDELVQ